MSKFQPVKFRDVEDLLAFIPDDEKEITFILRQLIFDSIPHVKEKLSYNVPFYYGNRRICFIWPGSVPWGKTKPGVEFGFTKGYLLSDDTGYLEKGNRKEVYIKTFYHPSEIDPAIIKMLLFEASQIDLRQR